MTSPDGHIKLALADGDAGLLELVRHYTGSGSLVLLDVPVDGCAGLDGRHFRPVDRALARQGIPLLPTSKAKDRGEVLKRGILSGGQGSRVTAQEIYPYAIYKFLAYLKAKGLLPRLAADRFDTLLDDGFRTYRPPRYKREREKVKRRENMEYLYSLLTDRALGLRFPAPLPCPDDSSDVDRLSDQYDACLGAIIGIHYARNSHYACMAGDSKSGNMLILADRWLAERLRREVPVGN